MKKIKTQLGGKFSRLEDGLFKLKRQIEDANILVEFPFNDKIIGKHNGIDVTFMPTAERSFYHIEIEFFLAMRQNPLHIVHNKFVDDIGYIGESASIEILYAILHNKPIIFLYEPNFSDKVTAFTKSLILKNIDGISVIRLDQLSTDKLKETIQSVAERKISYQIGIEEEVQIMEIVSNLLNSYKS